MLLKRVRELDPLPQRQIAALLGAAVADAAARPLHWEYDNAALQAHITEVWDTPEFLSESKSPFYTLPTGENSCYWDIAEASLRAVAGGYEYQNVLRELVRSFGAGNNKGYDMDAFKEFAKKVKARDIDTPLKGKYFHEAVLTFLAAYEADNHQLPFGNSKMRSTEGFCLSLPVAIKFFGHADFEKNSVEAVETMSTWKTSLQLAMVASNIVINLIKNPAYDIMSIGVEIADQYPKAKRCIEEIRDAVSNKWDHSTSVIQVFGPACNNPSSFQGAIHATVTSTSFTEAVRKTIRAGGCNCSRAFFIGAMCGAKYGIEGIPGEWVEKTTHSEEILTLALKAFS